jgi:hypothetical protein
MRPDSSYEEGCVGGESLMRLMRLPGEPPKALLVHSFVMVLGAVLTETDVVERASSSGEGDAFALLGGAAGRISGVLMGGEEASEAAAETGADAEAEVEPLSRDAAVLSSRLLLLLLLSFLQGRQPSRHRLAHDQSWQR